MIPIIITYCPSLVAVRRRFPVAVTRT